MPPELPDDVLAAAAHGAMRAVAGRATEVAAAQRAHLVRVDRDDDLGRMSAVTRLVTELSPWPLGRGARAEHLWRAAALKYAAALATAMAADAPMDPPAWRPREIAAEAERIARAEAEERAARAEAEAAAAARAAAEEAARAEAEAAEEAARDRLWVEVAVGLGFHDVTEAQVVYDGDLQAALGGLERVQSGRARSSEVRRARTGRLVFAAVSAGSVALAAGRALRRAEESFSLPAAVGVAAVVGPLAWLVWGVLAESEDVRAGVRDGLAMSDDLRRLSSPVRRLIGPVRRDRPVSRPVRELPRSVA